MAWIVVSLMTMCARSGVAKGIRDPALCLAEERASVHIGIVKLLISTGWRGECLRHESAFSPQVVGGRRLN
jgi:hypothetical protein